MVRITRVCCGCGCELHGHYEPKHFKVSNQYEFCEVCCLKLDNWVLEFRAGNI